MRILFPAGACLAILLSGCGGGGSSSPDHAPPTVTGVSPNSGPEAGGTHVVITGTGFKNGVVSSIVNFGPNPATSLAIISDTEIDVTTPFGPFGPSGGTTDVTVTLTYGPQPNVTKTSAKTAADKFTFN